ncbi:MAG: UDP-N-acetylmuramoyl-tripeptide--D-alanyl-D-alanine ligase [Candidatus Omnitrophica bacterium]|nr:UDP-N-acetylmuramoyl-tripeptide--D-alanyl-D-alanine ligase [Candidatus Omnitrophota bacterium]
MFILDEIIRATKGSLMAGDSNVSVRRVSIDSRQVRRGDLFIAIKGDRFDGHDFLEEVIGKGAVALVVHKPVQLKKTNVPVVVVDDTVKALGRLAHAHRLRFQVPVIAVTGSAGKTTTKEMIAAVLKKKYRLLYNKGTQNNHIGVPLTLLQLSPKHQMALVECGTNQPGDIAWLSRIARPDVAVFTNIGESHLERLKTLSGVLKEKWQLTAFMDRRSTAIINADDPLLLKQSRAPHRFKIMTYRPDNAMAAFACGRLFKVPAKDIAMALSAFRCPPGRGELVRLGKGWIINDSYNANPVSMRFAARTLDALKTKGKKIFVCADMLELGPKAKALHAAVGKYIAGFPIDYLITAGSLARLIAQGARKANGRMRIFDFDNAQAAQSKLTEILTNGDAVLVKGSRRMGMERVVESLKKNFGART